MFLFVACMFHSGIILFLRLLPNYCLFSSFGGFFLQKCLVFFFFLVSSSYQFFVLVVLFVCLQWHTVGAGMKVLYVGNPELWNFLPLKPGVDQSIAMHASPTARKVSIVLSDICLPSPFTVFSHYLSSQAVWYKWVPVEYKYWLPDVLLCVIIVN